LSRTYKPDPKAYDLGCNILQLKKEEILFVASASWDACGAKWFGYPTFWMNRLNSEPEALDVQPNAVGASMTALLDFVTNHY
jgi:2-haloacid dehalogenase